MTAAQMGTNPAPGVMATSPTTSPVQAPTSVVFLLLSASMSIQETKAAAEAVAEVINACAASPSAFKALPALNPNHPNQSMEAPSTTKGML